MEPVLLSVRRLCEFLLRSGDLTGASSGGFDRALEGARLHRKFQKQAGEGYEAEVTLKEEFLRGEVLFLLEGRADGVFRDEEGLTVVDEIKTHTLPAEDVAEDMEPLHWAQGLCYGALLMRREGIKSCAVRLTYVQAESEEVRRFQREYTLEEAERFLFDLLDRYAPWARAQRDWAAGRGEDLRALTFPFPQYRPGQYRLAGAAYRCFRDGGRLMAQAPTGIGKTVSVLFPALKALGEGHGSRIFYLTARTTGRQAARDALAMFHRDVPDLRLRSITLTAKDKICFLEERNCTPEACPYCRGYYDRIGDALWSGLALRQVTREALEELAREKRVCPFELGLDLSEWCDVVVGDYNHLFDPEASLKRFFERKSDSLFLIDEVHNLPDRARDMYSAALEKGQVLELKRALPKGRGALQKALGKLNRCLLALRKDAESRGERTVYTEELPEETVKAAEAAVVSLSGWLKDHEEDPRHGQALELYFGLRRFLRVAGDYDGRYRTEVRCSGSHVALGLLCLDPAKQLAETMALGRAAVLFSATLTPMDFYCRLCGCPEAKTLNLPSPFPQEHLGLYYATPDLRYQHREESLPRVAALAAAFFRARRGNYLVFLPSYAYLRLFREQLERDCPELRLLVQDAGMGEEARSEYLAAFGENPRETLVGLVVLGGVFAEGVDLTGDRLSGAVVVGVGLPQMNPRQELLREYYERENGAGFDFAYRFPGMNKVLQAAGRVIRRETDRGAVLLLDARFAGGAAASLLPDHWSHRKRVYTPEELNRELTRFWSGEDETRSK